MAVAALSSTLPVVAQPARGEPAPAIVLDEVLEGVETVAWSPDTLDDQIVVVEFWATWCGPCVGVLDHWNELVEAFAGEPVRFLSVTSESVERVRAFVLGRPIHGMVGLDLDGSLFADFAVRRIPHTFIIDAGGRLLADTYPSEVTAKVLRDVLAGKEIDLPSPVTFDDRVAMRIDPVGRPEALFLTELRPSVDADFRGVRVSDEEYVALGMDPIGCLLAAFEGRESRLEIEVELPDQRYDFVIRTPGGDERRRALMQQVVCEAFQVAVAFEPRRREVLVLRGLAGAEHRLEPATGASSFSSYPGRIQGRGLDFWSLANSLEYVVDVPVLDETGLEGRFDIDLEWDPADPGSLEKSLAEVGLELQAGDREIEVLVVRAADP